jgi:predicted RNA-binding Zn-ribbon protein involved in translation (DUF1610 family)
MSLNVVIVALVLYPLLYVLRINPIRFQWGFKNGLAPMPPEFEERAEAADRALLFVADLVLLVVVVLLMHGSLISAYEVGLTSDNWKSALGMGAMLSLLPLGLSKLFLSNVPPEVARKELESHGPVATWCGLIALGSSSHEFWRAFCIVALIRLGLSALLAVVIVAVFFATISLQTSIARALGSAAFGGAAGFLLVNTGSLLAPLTMSLIVGGANLYQVRHASASIAQIGKNQGIRPSESRYSRPCPVCGAIIRLSEVHREVDMLACPNCGECLTREKKYLWLVGVLSLMTAAYATRHLVYRDPAYILVTEGAALVLFFVGTFLFGLLAPPKYKRVKGKPFDKALSLFGTNKSDADKKPTHD